MVKNDAEIYNEKNIILFFLAETVVFILMNDFLRFFLFF